MRPVPQSYGHNFPGLIDQFVPCLTTDGYNFVPGFEYSVGEPVIAHELPYVFDRVELW